MNRKDRLVDTIKKPVRITLTFFVLFALAITGALALPATPSYAAQPTPRNGICEKGEFCYYYNSNQTGSVSDFTGSLGNYGTTQPSCYEFKGTGNGKGRCIKNDAASVWNNTNGVVRVYYNSNYAGYVQDIEPGAKVNLLATLKNNNASHKLTPYYSVESMKVYLNLCKCSI